MTPQLAGLFTLIGNQRWKARIVSIDHLPDLEDAIRLRFESGLIDEALYQGQLCAFSFLPPPHTPPMRSIIIVAVPTPPMRLYFYWKGKDLPVVIPPTYVSYAPRTENVQAILAGWLRDIGYHFARPQLPLKTLAVQSGLARYGRNNICFVPGMGSFLQLVAAYSDLPCESDLWEEPAAMDRCGSCTACVKLCPTGAIAADRFLIHAERCLSFHNEAAARFPDWVDPSWHHCLVGCMRCQTSCPENKPLRGWVEDRARFSETETEMLIRGTPFEYLPSETAAKIRALEINEEYHRIFGRNLTLALRQYC